MPLQATPEEEAAWQRYNRKSTIKNVTEEEEAEYQSYLAEEPTEEAGLTLGDVARSPLQHIGDFLDVIPGVKTAREATLGKVGGAVRKYAVEPSLGLAQT